jgi:3-carboxy-cis,cis-muconate cycloisomerase
VPEITKHFDRTALERLTDPANYLGLAPQMVDKVLQHSAKMKA